jgi:hypothetical protein
MSSLKTTPIISEIEAPPELFVRPVPIAEVPRIYPPRAKGLLNPTLLARPSMIKGLHAQLKLNDVRLLIHLHPDGNIELLTRQLEAPREYVLTDAMMGSLRALKLPKGVDHLLDGGVFRKGELRIRDRIVLWDILVFSGRYLLGSRYGDRYRFLRKCCGNPNRRETETGRGLGLRINANLWLIEEFTEHFSELYESYVDLDEVEGLMLKDPRGKLEWGLQPENNSSWQLRVRKPHPNYAF